MKRGGQRAKRARRGAAAGVARAALLAGLLSAPAAAQAPLEDPVSEAGRQARGLYLGANFVHRAGHDGTIRAARSARVTAVVLDLKDAEGRVHHDTSVAEFEEMETGWLGDTRALLDALHDADLYAIARVVCFADRALPERAPERAIHDVRPARQLWVSWGTGGTWLDPHHEANHALVVALAREAEALGFDEIQLDYVRFPVDDGVRYARYPAQSEESRTEVLLRLLRAVDEAVSVPLGVDVFGLAAYRDGDPSGLGQDLEAWSDYVEVYTPMLYLNSMRAWRAGEEDRAFRLVFGGTRRLRRRLGREPVIRPFLQAFQRGAGEPLTPELIFEQIRAARRAGADGFLFWHPGQRYRVVRQAMRGRSRALVPFPAPR